VLDERRRALRHIIPKRRVTRSIILRHPEMLDDSHDPFDPTEAGASHGP
jgi:hypothetical protein